MKTFVEYLKESIDQNKYKFIIKIAGDIPEHCEDTMRKALDKYQVSSFNKLRTTPIQKKLPDFPTMENSQVTVYETILDYPTTSTVLHSYVSENIGVPSANIKILSDAESQEHELNSENCEAKKDKPLLLKPLDKEKQPELHGEKHISKFLKELQKTKHGLEQYKGVNDQLLAKLSPKESNKG